MGGNGQLPPIPARRRRFARRARPVALPRRSSGNRRAFTLPEVLLAVALLAVAGVAVGQAVRGALDLLGRARAVEQPAVERSIGREALLRAGSLEEAEEGDRINLPEGGDLRWEAEVEETDLPDLFSVRLRVDGEAGEREERLFLYRPDWSNPVDRGPLQEDARRQIEDRLEEIDR